MLFSTLFYRVLDYHGHNPRLPLTFSVALYFTFVELICLYSEKLLEYHHLLFLGIVIKILSLSVLSQYVGIFYSCRRDSHRHLHTQVGLTRLKSNVIKIKACQVGQSANF